MCYQLKHIHTSSIHPSITTYLSSAAPLLLPSVGLQLVYTVCPLYTFSKMQQWLKGCEDTQTKACNVRLIDVTWTEVWVWMLFVPLIECYSVPVELYLLQWWLLWFRDCGGPKMQGRETGVTKICPLFTKKFFLKSTELKVRRKKKQLRNWDSYRTNQNTWTQQESKTNKEGRKDKIYSKLILNWADEARVRWHENKKVFKPE